MSYFVDTMAEARRAWLMREPNVLPDGDCAVLMQLGPDLTVLEWSKVLGRDVMDIERACAWLNVHVKKAGL
jgi:hypothetical protein